MNNNEVKNVENKQNNSLMRKTRVQLVEIILRKDSIEKDLRDDIANTKVELNKVKTKIDTMQYNYSELESNYFKLKSDYIDICDMCDEKTLVEHELKNTINKQRGLIWFLVIIFVISITANIALYLI